MEAEGEGEGRRRGLFALFSSSLNLVGIAKMIVEVCCKAAVLGV